jgi:crossover junction endodeoxyribonuclease RuvC
LRILGIDPGSRATGYGAIDTDGTIHRLVEHGVVRSPSALSFPARLHRIHTRVLEVIDRCSPELMVVESLFHASNARSALKLGHVRGAVIVAGVSRGLPVHEYAPLEVKQAVVGYGRADKQQVQNMVTLLLKLDEPPRPDDASDALAVALCHAHQMRFVERVRTSTS